MNNSAENEALKTNSDGNNVMLIRRVLQQATDHYHDCLRWGLLYSMRIATPATTYNKVMPSCYVFTLKPIAELAIIQRSVLKRVNRLSLRFFAGCGRLKVFQHVG